MTNYFIISIFLLLLMNYHSLAFRLINTPYRLKLVNNLALGSTISKSSTQDNIIRSINEELIELLLSVKKLNYSHHEKVGLHVKSLESTFIPIHTPEFLDIAVGGEWKLIYSNAPLPHADPNMTCKITQTISPNLQYGDILHQIV
mmetsp:Transcript_7947/g.8103  ORF Transcript_7947/g.8103 Transcript_7947/m.8103 type:complete len:145 (-) Transcript_7947:145-579(-)